MSVALRCIRHRLPATGRSISRSASITYPHPNTLHLDLPEETESAPEQPRFRFSQYQRHRPELYPRITPQANVIDYPTFKKRYIGLARDESGDEEVVVRGRIWSFRIAGSKLAFIDIVQSTRTEHSRNHQLQCLLNFDKISKSGVSPTQCKDFLSFLQRGDIYSCKGIPHRTHRQELSLALTDVPQLLAKCTQNIPEQIKDPETLSRNRHLDMLLHARPVEIIELRSEITAFLRQWLSSEGHLEVQTPILADTAGGAVARPFATVSTEFPERQIALRIAPELWLKRLILGGFERVFEIGPSFRNEGIDRNHNPEFTTCEFYRTYADIEELIHMTENMFLRLSRIVESLVPRTYSSLDSTEVDFSPPYPRLDFIPALEAATGRQLPKLTSPEAQATLTMLCVEKNVPLPSLPTVPRLLDKLSATYLEPQCSEPTWIINHPECMSPLSKSFVHPDKQQRVAARAELFVLGQEYVNAYEEENSPVEQRRKFEEQVHSEGNAEACVDEDYLQALKWGLPPTGGWGCGVDRLCMLFSGSIRIADVLPFGTLKNVVALRQTVKQV